LSKPYSSKALPAGTVIREWRIEDVLGVGGFGIVYKGRGIYFGELVAIKEYFPSAISERDAESTVVPIGSDVEEVHALGLKKFVEEAKLLWNLSTPTRHPNIVSVRALFEVHGTAYMVMDFEDGVSLSRLLKEGRRFNERSLWNVIKPVAEGLDRAHRVGVLHRDIKPPNILITDDNRPVLIDFGSARFEAAEATSTSVTFHTPPYAAVEQYVKTYPQGPWTDIYAMSVVLYECVTGEKPPEVLERMHGGLGSPLADGHWPGFSKRFLQAIDAGMTIKPSERPQSIREWLALFGRKDSEEIVAGDDEPTRFFAHEMASNEISAVAPTAPGIDQKDLDTGVPQDPADVQFKRAGEETGASKKAKKKKVDEEEEAPAAIVPADLDEEEVDDAPPPSKKPAPAVETRRPAPPPPRPRDTSDKWYKDPRKAMLAGGGAVALVAAIAAGTFMMGGGSSDSGAPLEIPDLNTAESIPVEGLGQLIAAERTLVEDAKTAGAPGTAINDLVTANDQLDKQLAALQPLADDSSQTAAASTRVEQMKRTATAANVAFATALLRDADAKAQSLPRTAQSAAVSTTLTDLRTSVEGAANSTDPVQSLGAARDALAKSQAFSAAITNAYTALAANKTKVDKLPQAPKAATQATVATPTAAPTATATAPAATASSSSAGPSATKQSQLNSIVSSGRAMAKKVMRSGSRENAAQAKGYDRYLANVADSARGARTDAEMDRLIKQASQTKAYLVFLQKQSSQAQ
jgi:serine/threonine protein kinase